MAHFHIPKPLHGWRQFVGEVGIIVLGVLIALAAEQLVEQLHWRTKVSRAEEAMRLELAQDDGPQAYGRIAVSNCLEERIGSIFNDVGRVPTDQLRRQIDAYAPPSRVWDSEAWKAVIASDVGNQIGAEGLIDWSASYRLIPALSEVNQREAELVTDLHVALPRSGEPSPSDLQEVRKDAALLKQLNGKMRAGSKLVLARMAKVGAQVPAPTARTLLAKARQMYGSCVQIPNPNAPATQDPIVNLRNSVWDSLAK